jgi:hypothetical protein
MPRWGLFFLMPWPAAIYGRIGAANAVLTADAGTGRSVWCIHKIHFNGQNAE